MLHDLVEIRFIFRQIGGVFENVVAAVAGHPAIGFIVPDQIVNVVFLLRFRGFRGGVSGCGQDVDGTALWHMRK